MMQVVESQPRVMAYLCAMGCDKELAAELTQRVMVRCWERRSGYQEQGCLMAWVLRVATNIYHDAIRRRTRDPITIDTSDDRWEAMGRPWRLGWNVIESRRTPLDILIREELLQSLDDALFQLNEMERRVLYLRYQEDLSSPQIARRLAMPLGTVLSIAHRAQMKLRRDLTV
ncbi:MAG: sigma-70 family RNA polymerase sigma factor [Phycisphaeraceae bacterium]